ncbi:bifunctional UDP-sugar hydrolase/5'-nucleotidase [Paenibacillus sp. XY044]|uniref:bifunctional metallophosphatase/5'-nucleotidase n=1 Tax=Paenibacillus sp. XY044 TaxID=2026089 RepID=UPI0015C5FB1B|nr:bifunctional UDP-sugar hydrolase/5'-nucleotidase [Paenibacillus sp. XY044]
MLQNQAKSITILHTNDIHSHFETVSSIAALAAAERAQAAESPLLLVDIGDHMDRTAVETEGTMGQTNIDILNLTGYEAVTIGNNEGLTFTPDVLERLYAGLQSPVICCNIHEQLSSAPPAWMKKSVILDKEGIRIGLTAATAPFADFYKLLGWDALEPLQALQEQVEVLRPKADIVIVLSHLGLSTDRLMAERISGIDLILGGHTHHLLEEPLRIGNTVLCAAGKYGQYVGKVVMAKQDDGSFRVVEGGCRPIDTDLLDETVSRALGIHRERAEEALTETVAVTDRPLPLTHTGESPFGNLLAQSVRQFTGAELSLVNTGQLLGDLPEGEITAGLLHELCPSPINPCIVSLKGELIRQTLEESLLSEYWSKEIRGFGFRGNVLGNIAVDGIEVLYDTSRIPYDRIVQISLQGIPLQDDRMYSVGTLDMFTFGTGYEQISRGKDPKYLLPEFLRDLLRLELQRPGSLDTCGKNRWIEVV